MRASIESRIVAPSCGVRMLSTSSMMWPQPVLDDAAAAGLAGEVVLEGELERLLAPSSTSVKPIRCAITSPAG